jgi:MoxR-like ATPase
VGAERQRLLDRGPSLAQAQDEIGLAVIDEIGDLGRAVVRIDRHAADADAVEGQRVKHMLGPILQQRRDAMTDAVARAAEDLRQFLDPSACLAVRDLEARRQVAALLVGRHRQERPTGVGGDGGCEHCSDGRAVHDLGHWLPLLRARAAYACPGWKTE